MGLAGTNHKIHAVISIAPALCFYNHKGHVDSVSFIWDLLREAFLLVYDEPKARSRLQAPRKAQDKNRKDFHGGPNHRSLEKKGARVNKPATEEHDRAHRATEGKRKKKKLFMNRPGGPQILCERRIMKSELFQKKVPFFFSGSNWKSSREEAVE